MTAYSQDDCTCPGWCYFNPGQHHVNCQCWAKVHLLAEWTTADGVSVKVYDGPNDGPFQQDSPK